MLVIEFLKQHAGLLQSLIVLINYVLPLSGSRFTNDDDFNFKKSELCMRNCTSTDKCCQYYYCTDGLCRKPDSNIEFIVLAKVSLEITFALLLAAIFVFLLRGLFNIICKRYQWFGEQENRCGVGSSRLYGRQCHEERFPITEAIPDKPPSYEECVRSSSGRPVLDSPPPYTISASLSSDFGGTELTSAKLGLDSPNMIPLDVQALGAVLDQISEESRIFKKLQVSENQ